mmetsp:Transcript_20341/g.30079  ORF Transcript_20341/g.30079 Transcript_20341/m.30079 type:complete len:322 (+) Transcript_20341:106-1071(+)|eukprot:CAMPEP_0171461174 /NCGR_PEP_ID=MMETSP0945-20130129/5733_1 /TAXON_ID=109269 /ORGANISM="Vaucheria litorea, Strain CCMP2940" /LENGTH=321 /DNA_ID=CAMNT_0011987479 /DNA_START=101 /DNA_END=1066 /DNA_ORIENTATION=-
MSKTPLTIESKVTLKSGTEMPIFGLGTWRSEKGRVKDAVLNCLLNGYIHIDAAHCYQNQEEVGDGIIDSKVPRDKIFVTSKLWCTHLQPDRARNLIKTILSDLKLNYVDQLLIHWPCPFKYVDEQTLFPANSNGHIQLDPDVDLRETWKVMEEFVEGGLVKSIGVSNFTIQEIEYISKDAKIKPDVNQIEIHPYFTNSELVDYCTKNGIHITAYSPLGNFDPNSNLPSVIKDETVLSIAKKYSKTPAQVIIRWHLQKGHTVIPKTVTLTRLVENSNVFDFELSIEEMNEISSLGKKNFRLCNPRFHPNNGLAFPNDTSAFE